MAFVLIEHIVGDFETFAKVYLDDGPRRRRSGSKGGAVYRVSDDPNDLIILLEWDNADNAREFAESLDLREAMKWSTSNVSTPRVTVLEHVMDSAE
jgi:heme-degrading monooxygenase HmoA